MDPITMAIVAALSAGVVGGVTKLGEDILVDAYDALKAALKNSLGIDSEALKAVEALEKRPESAARREVLKEEIVASKANEDPDILNAAQVLLDHIRTRPDGMQHIQSAVGSFIAQADRGSTANISVNQKPE